MDSEDLKLVGYLFMINGERNALITTNSNNNNNNKHLIEWRL